MPVCFFTVRAKESTRVWMDGWPREDMFISPWVTASKTTATDCWLAWTNDGSRRKECETAIQTAVPAILRQAAINRKLWEPCLVVLSMLFVPLYINGWVQLLNGLATRNHMGVWPRPCRASAEYCSPGDSDKSLGNTRGSICWADTLGSYY